MSKMNAREPESINELISHASDDELVRDIYWRIVKAHGDNNTDVSTCSEHERVVVLVDLATGIIGNGGFEYLFENDLKGDPDFLFTAAAFKKAGLERSYSAFLEAFSLFPRGKVPRYRKRRVQLYGAIDEGRRLEINRKFWQDGISGDCLVERKLAQYIREHPASFSHLDGGVAGRVPRLDADE
jgi:hypothetical protein